MIDMLMRRVGRTCLTLLVVSALGFAAHATMVVPRTLDELVGRADLILVGKVTHKEVNSQPDAVLGDSISVSRYKFQVADVLKGATVKAGDLFTFQQVGGNGAAGLRVVGATTYTEGQEYLLFLKLLPNDLWTTVGMEQGKFTVRVEGGKKVVENGFGNRWVFGVGTSGKLSVGKGLSKGESAVLEQQGGPASYDDVISLIKRLNQ